MDHPSGNFGKIISSARSRSSPQVWIGEYSSGSNTAPTTPWSARYQVLFALGVAAVKIHVGWFCLDLEDISDMCDA